MKCQTNPKTQIIIRKYRRQTLILWQPFFHLEKMDENGWKTWRFEGFSRMFPGHILYILAHVYIQVPAGPGTPEVVSSSQHVHKTPAMKHKHHHNNLLNWLPRYTKAVPAQTGLLKLLWRIYLARPLLRTQDCCETSPIRYCIHSNHTNHPLPLQRVWPGGRRRWHWK